MAGIDGHTVLPYKLDHIYERYGKRQEVRSRGGEREIKGKEERLGRSTHCVLNFVDDGLAGCFDAKVSTHIGDVICSCASADYALCVHHFS